RHLGRKLPIVLHEEVVIGGARVVVCQAAPKNREVHVASKEILEAREIDLPAIEGIEVNIHAVEAELATESDHVAAAGEGDAVGQTAGEGGGGAQRRWCADHDASRSRRYANQREAGEDVSVGPFDAEIGIP